MEMPDGSLAPARVLGVGNVLTTDDGMGPYALATLAAEWDFPPDVELVDVGTPGLDFTPYLAGASLVIVVDAVRSGGEPGAVRVWRDEELLKAPPVARTNPHEPGLREALMATELEDRRPQHMVLIGAVPESLETGTRLTASGRRAAADAALKVVAELKRHGHVATRRAEPLPKNIWWE